MATSDLMEKIVSLCKRRGFVFPGSEIYGGLANSWDYGPLGVELKNNIKRLWWERFVGRRDDIFGIDPAVIMSSKVWEASGHVKEFADPLVECKQCHGRFRPDLIEGVCPNCGVNDFTFAKNFNLLFRTHIGPVDDSSAEVYLRGELAQAMFVDFPNVLQTTRAKLPFGIAAQGKAFRNEITPGNFIFRTREFDLMEFEYFIREDEWEKWFEYWRKEMWSWITDDLGVQESRLHELEVPDGERAHYSKRTIDFEYDYPFGKKELYGLAYRTDFDLKNHFKQPPYKDQETGEAFYPHVVEPTWGVDRSVLVVLLDAYTEDGDRVVLKLKPRLAPYKAAVFPLLANKPDLVAKAREIYQLLTTNYSLHGPIAWDDRGNIGKRYYAQDEIGTPYCITVDFDTLEKGDVTVRDRDTAKQERVKIEELKEFLQEKIYGSE
ncbi:MAG: glycine--tRNA ligase [Candidatus Liptonbacteria bacterium RIFCSPLOWO2_01_FULL_53_13]|uniref:glycine--tRNA ligase n=1 Tax=Candidatus Liptonbacteria bacterium RIFCSPLOWO2_01_FULL_53_13 TaxID=1798651 RepID=A0A1G2CM34_9BACT|nr:MAG: glycine--tRNA ligase [Candidatus Liptonbacteria bacterium RIFCSPLOWO2_01_FULL_53_13]